MVESYVCNHDMVLNGCGQTVIVYVHLQCLCHVAHYPRSTLITNGRHTCRNWRGRQISEDVLLNARRDLMALKVGIKTIRLRAGVDTSPEAIAEVFSNLVPLKTPHIG